MLLYSIVLRLRLPVASHFNKVRQSASDGRCYGRKKMRRFSYHMKKIGPRHTSGRTSGHAPCGFAHETKGCNGVRRFGNHSITSELYLRLQS
jgi:hypothetical protein